MAQVPTQSWTARDFQSTMEALKIHLKAQFPDGHWEKLLEQDVPLGMLSALAWMHEQDAFYMDRRWQNTYLDLADEREAVISLCKQISYQPRPRTSASAPVRLYPQPVKPVPIVIPAGTLIPYEETYFEFIEDATIPAFSTEWPDATSADVIAVTEGQTKETRFTADGSEFQSYEIPFDNVIQGSLSVEIAGEEWDQVESLIYNEGDTLGRDVFAGDGTDSQLVTLTLFNAIIDPDDPDTLTVLVDGVQWIQVTTFTGGPNEFVVYQSVDGVTTIQFGLAADGSAPGNGSIIDCIYLITGAQKRYTLFFDQNDRPTINFGDDQSGKIPPSGSEIKVTYRVGGGIVGNVEIGEIDSIVQGYLNAPPQSETDVVETAEVRVFNYGKGSGGNKQETIDHAKFYAPQYAKSNERAVTRSDWEVIASTYFDARYGAPAYAAAKLHQEIPELNQVDVSLWSRDSTGRLTVAGESLKEAVRKELQARRTMCTYVEMVDGVTYYLDVFLAVSLKSGFFATTVFSNLQAAVQSFFDSALVMPGRDIRINRLFEKLNEVEGVYSVTIENIIGTVLLEQSQTSDGSTNVFDFIFQNPLGQALVPESVQITTGIQTANDDGEGSLIGDVDLTGTNTVDYDTGKITVTLQNIPPGSTNVRAEVRYYARLEWEEDHSSDYVGLDDLDFVTDYLPIVKRPPIGVAQQTVDFYIPDYLMPPVPGRYFFLGGYGSPGGLIGMGELWAYDDGEGNIAGDVHPSGVNTINYQTGRVQFTWNKSLYPGVSSYTGTLTQNADGSRTEFDFTVAGWPAALPIPTPTGNLRLDFSSYPTWGAEAVFYGNWQFQIFGTYLENKAQSYYGYGSILPAVPGGGKLYFATPPQSPGAPPHTFPVSFGPVTHMLYSTFVFYVKNPTSPGHELYWFAENTGKIWGTTPDAYPTTRLDHKTGHYVGRLSSTVQSGRTVKVLYDAFLQSKYKNVPIKSNAIGTFSRTVSRQLEEEIDL